MALQSIFFVSSPLQAFVVFSIVSESSCFKPKADVIIFVEEGIYFPKIADVVVVPLSTTRGNKGSIRDNMLTVLKYISGSVNLWVSDLMWPMNNHAYSELKSRALIGSINFFDEGVVNYLNHGDCAYRYVYEILKSLALKLRLGKYSLPRRTPFFGYEKQKYFCVLNPHIFNKSKAVTGILFSDRTVSKFSNEFKNELAKTKRFLRSSDCCVFVSTPMYRVFGEDHFERAMRKLCEFLDSRKIEKRFVKMHPSESLDEYEKIYKPFGFDLLHISKEVPFELFVSSLRAKSVLIGFNSSALLNAKKFGCSAQVILYGSNLFKQNFFLRDKFVDFKLPKLFLDAGVEVEQ
jgi:hypothetical protein